MAYDFIITGPVGESSGCDEDQRTDKYVGQRAEKWRVCLNEATTICKTEAGESVWAPEASLKRIALAMPEVGKGMFFCACPSGSHESKPVNEQTILRALGHVAAVWENAVKMSPPKAKRSDKTAGLDRDDFIRDRAPNSAYAGFGGGIEQARRMKRYGATTAWFCTEVAVARHCVAQGWLVFNDDLSGTRITPKGIAEHARLLTKQSKAKPAEGVRV